MAVTYTTEGSSNAIAALYQAAYIMAVRKPLAYSQAPFVYVPPQGVMGVGNRGSAVNLPLFHQLNYGSSLSESADITPSRMYANLATITPELYGQAIQLSQKLSLEAFTDVEAAAVELIGRNAGETRDKLARTAVCGGALVIFGGDATARAEIAVNQGTTTDTITYNHFVQAVTMMDGAGVPKLPGGANGLGGYAAIISAETQADLGQSSALILAAEYGTNSFLLNGEIGTHLTGTRIVQSPNAKRFRCAGASHGTSGASAGGTMDAVVPGSTVLQVSAAPTSWAIGDYIGVGGASTTAEATGVDDLSGIEIVRVISGTSNTTGPFGIVGAGVNGGFMYAHAGTEVVQGNVNGRSGDVQATVFCGPESVAMVYSNEDGLGPEGMIVLPEAAGILHQFNNTGWKGFWGFGRVSENRIVRVEHGSSFQSLGH